MAFFAVSPLGFCKVLAIIFLAALIGLIAHGLYVTRFNRRIDQRYRDWLSQEQNNVQEYCERRARNEYQYEPLDLIAERQNIRLIELQPAKEGKIVFRMYSMPLEQAAEQGYEALSYCWGNRERLYLIFNQDSKHVIVTWNLFSALMRFRYADRPRLLWVDAICINQSDLEEKAIQVNMMSEIYRNAEHVLVWLNKEDDMPHEQEKEIGNLVEGLSKARDLMILANDERTFWQLDNESLQKYGISKYLRFNLQLVGFFNITLLPWFRRIWIVQEISVARKVTVHCGKWSVSWDRLYEVWTFLTEKLHLRIQTNIFNDVYVAQRMDMLGLTRLTASTRSECSLLRILQRHRAALATNLRDKVFALTGLATDEVGVEINYKRSCDDVYIDTARRVLQRSNDLDILSFVGTHCRADGSCLPSWVPDWRVTLNVLPLVFEDTDTNFRSTGDSIAHVRFDLSGHRLVINGYSIGTVFQTSLAARPYNAYIGSWRDTINLADEILSLGSWAAICNPFSTKVYAHSGETFAQVFMLTMHVGNLNLARDTPVPENFHNSLRWLCYLVIPISKLYIGPLRYVAKILAIILFVTAGLLFWMGWSNVDLSVIAIFCTGRQFVVTDNGYIALAPGDTKPGDILFLLEGGKVPIVLQKAADEIGYLVVGDCYAHGCMDGSKWLPEKCHPIWLV